MRHQVAGRKLNRTASHRKAMFANMACALGVCTTCGANLIDKGWDGAQKLLDGDKDGKFSFNDVKIRADQAKDWLASKGSQALGWAGDQVNAAGKALHNMADRDGDGKIGWGDVKAGASQAKEWAGDKISSAGKAIGAAKDWVGNKASAAWDGAKSAGSTLVSGVSGAAKTVGGTLKKAKDFFGGW